MQIDFSKGGGEEAFISTCVLNVIEIKLFYARVSTLVYILFQSILTFFCFLTSIHIISYFHKSQAFVKFVWGIQNSRFDLTLRHPNAGQYSFPSQ